MNKYDTMIACNKKASEEKAESGQHIYRHQADRSRSNRRGSEWHHHDR